MRAWLSSIGGLLATAASTFLVLANGRPPPSWATPHEKLAAIGVVGSVAAGSAFARPLRIYLTDVDVATAARVAVALRILAWTVHDQFPELPIREIGASAYLVRGFTGSQRLRRIVRERVNDWPDESGVSWTKGKGVVGRCWEMEVSDVVDFRELYAPITNKSRQAWEAVGTDVHMKLKHAEYLRLHSKYDVVVVAPLRRNGKVIGVLALDIPNYRGRLTVKTRDQLQRDVISAAAHVSGLLTHRSVK